MKDIAISVRNVSKCYRVYNDQRSRLMHAIWPKYNKGMQEIWALDDINFEIARGEAVAIIGRNGSGKSTLLEILAGTLTATTGEVTVNGRVSALLELGSGFNPEYTGRDNVIVNCLLLGLSRDEILSRFTEVEDFAEIGDAIDRPVKTYSSGMLMRLAFAVQVLCKPEILIIDEALSVGDFFFQQKCLSYIRNLCANGVTLLFVSHEMGTVRDLCGRALYLQAGNIQFYGDTKTACRLYFESAQFTASELSVRHQLPDITASPPPDLIDLSPTGTLNSAIWSKDTTLVCQGNLADILGISILDSQGNMSESFAVGDTITVRTAYRVNCGQPIHVSLELSNRSGLLITCIGSYTKSVAPPVSRLGDVLICDINLKLAVESGRYGLKIVLGIAEERGNVGVTVDESPVLGPIIVHWDYEKAVAPHFGLVGLPYTVSFMTNYHNGSIGAG